MTEHPDFLAADEAHRWVRPLPELAVRLREAAWRLKGGWAYWLLPAGACVAMRVVPDGDNAFRKELCLSRRGIQKPDPALWDAEVTIFQRYLGCDGWQRAPRELEREIDTPTYRAVTCLLEPAALGVKAKPPENLCSRCGKPTPHEPEYAADLCPQCAAKAGAEEVAAKQGTLDLPPYPGGGEPERPGGEPT